MTTRTRAQVFATAHDRIAANTNPRLDVARNDLNHAAPRFTQACRAMQDARPTPLGAANLDGNVAGGTGSNPTMRLALAGDPGRNDRINMDRHLRILLLASTNPDRHHAVVTRAAYGIRVLVDAYTPKPPTDKQRRSIALENDRDLCEHHRAHGMVEPVKHTGTVSGNLTEPMGLCGPCYERVRYTGKLPTVEWMERLARTGKVEGERV